MRVNKYALAARLYEPLLGRLLLPLRQRVLDSLHVQCPAGGRVLDMCCGPGGLTGMVASAGFSALGADLDADMLHEARRQTQSRALLRNGVAPGWVQADARCLPFAENSFDAAVVSMALHAMPWRVAAAALGELRRVARTVIVADYCLAERNLHCPAIALGAGLERLVGGAHYRCYVRFMVKGGIEGLLHHQGLSVRDRHSVLGGAVTVAVCCG